MPYVPSKKTDGKSRDRELIDVVVEKYAHYLVDKIEKNYDAFSVLLHSFIRLNAYICRYPIELQDFYKISEFEIQFVNTVLKVGEKYGYDGAFLGELNYGLTRTIQRVPQILAEQGKCGLVIGEEIRYWVYAMIVSALTKTAYAIAPNDDLGICGVFEDVKDEFKVRFNKSYEIEQILKSGDCYDTPYFNKVVEIVDENNNHIGYTYIELKNDGENVKLDKMPYKLMVKY